MIAASLIGGKTLISGFSLNNDSSKSTILENGLPGVEDKSTRTAINQTSSTTIKDGVQYVTSSMTSGSYEPITVQQGIPVQWTLRVPDQVLNGCNSSISIPEYNIQLKISR